MADKKLAYENIYNSISTIIDILGDIDKKISELRTCSSDDFSQFNDFLKTYHADARQISENSDRIINVNSISNDHKIFEVKDLLLNLNTIISQFENEINASLMGFEKVLRLFNLVLIPLRNFNQNILSINLILTSLGMNKSLQIINQNSDFKLVKSSLKDFIQSDYDAFDIPVSQLAKDTNTIYQQINKLKNNLIYEIESHLNQINAAFLFIEKKDQELKKQLPTLGERIKKYQDSVYSIITNLQYEDIIRQRMEHIQDAHKIMIEELKTSNENEKALASYFQVRKILTLQVAQLLHTNKQYQEAIKSIVTYFHEIGNHVDEIGTISQHISLLNLQDSLHYFGQIQRKIDSSVQQYTGFIVIKDEILPQSNKILEKLAQQQQRFQKTIPAIDKLEQSIYSLLEKQQNNGLDQQTGAQLKSTINAIRYDQSSISNGLQRIEEVMKQAVDKLGNCCNERNYDKRVETVIDQYKKVTNSVQNISGQYNSGKQLLAQNLNFSNTISESIKSNFDTIKFYSLFNSTTSQIIVLIEQIYTILEQNEPGLEDTFDKKLLDSLSKKYTMKSERLIHENVLKGNDKNETDAQNDNSETNKNNEDNDNVEFF